MNMENLKVLSLFDGMSVAQQALKNINAGLSVYYASEIDEYAKAVTQSNFADTVQIGDVSNVTLKADIDIIIGGSPCQDLSIAKRDRKGLAGSKSGLFYQYLRIRDELKPKFFILENVNSMTKEAKTQITQEIGVEPVMINASLVSAQSRKRLFWVGKLEGDRYVKVDIPQPEDKKIILADILESGSSDRVKSCCIDASYYKGASLDVYLKKGKRQVVFETDRIGEIYPSQGGRIYSTKGKSVTLASNAGGAGAKTGLYKIYDKIRKLTPIECLRLQSMPDNYFDKVLYKNNPISNTQRYKMCGNAFNCKVIEHILLNLK